MLQLIIWIGFIYNSNIYKPNNNKFKTNNNLCVINNNHSNSILEIVINYFYI